MGGGGICIYHSDRPEGQQVVILLAVAPGIPAGVLSLLQDVHLTTEVHLLESHKAVGETELRGIHPKIPSLDVAKMHRRLNTYGPHSTRRERTRSMPMSQTFMHSLLISIMRPWKFSWSNTYICWKQMGTNRILMIFGRMITSCYCVISV